MNNNLPEENHSARLNRITSVIWFISFIMICLNKSFTDSMEILGTLIFYILLSWGLGKIFTNKNNPHSLTKSRLIISLLILFLASSNTYKERKETKGVFKNFINLIKIYAILLP